MYDLIYSVIFLLFIFYHKRSFTSLAELVDEENITTADYALEIHNIPRTGVTE